MRSTHVLVPAFLALGFGLWLALRERAPESGPAVEQGRALDEGAPRALPPSKMREVAGARSAEYVAPVPPVDAQDAEVERGEHGAAPPPKVGGGWHEDLGAVDVGHAQPRDEQAQTRLTPSELPRGARFGEQVALSGTIAAVAAPIAEGNGVVFVFERAGSRWNEAARLVAPERPRMSGFGAALALSGARLAVGAPGDAGAVVAFRRRRGGWNLELASPAPERAAGIDLDATVAVMAERLIAGHPGALLELRAATGYLSAALDGRFAACAVRGTSRPCVVVLDWNDGAWDRFDVLCREGWSVPPTTALAGDRLATVAGRELALYDLGLQFEVAVQLTALELPPRPGSARPVALAGERVFVGDPAGAVLRFARAGDEWRAERPLVARDATEHDGLGTSLAADGPLVLAGAPGGGYAVVWELAPPVARRPGR